MKINRFKGVNVNGYLNFDIPFYKDLTFITGINGTGKTSALNSIAALLLPRLEYLAGEYFEEISIEIEHEEKATNLVATKVGSETQLSCSLFPNEKLIIPEYEALETLPLHRALEIESDFYKEIIARNSTHPVMEFITSLPTPMYLGLDRRSLSMDHDVARYARLRSHRPTKKRNIFGRSLGQSLDEALYFAQEQFRRNNMLEARLERKFRENLVLTLIDFPPISFSGKLEDPSKKELDKIEMARKNLQRLPELLGVSNEIIAKNVDPMFDFLDKKITTINKPTVEKESKERGLSERIEALIDWSYNKTHITKINRLSEIVSDYNTERGRVFKKTNEFLDTVNSFIVDSEKTLIFSSLGQLKFRLHDDEKERDIRTLSSGEIQLIVILTHLYFNPEVDKANVFIIDEPELSLHVQWQEKFVDGIMTASTTTQFILATHSPSIILDKTSSCIEISANS